MIVPPGTGSLYTFPATWISERDFSSMGLALLSWCWLINFRLSSGWDSCEFSGRRKKKFFFNKKYESTTSTNKIGWIICKIKLVRWRNRKSSSDHMVFIYTYNKNRCVWVDQKDSINQKNSQSNPGELRRMISSFTHLDTILVCPPFI